MNNKVALVYQNGEYNVTLNDSVIKTDKDFDNAVYQFKQTIASTSATAETKSWEVIKERVLAYEETLLEINSDYKTITFGAMKYFYTTGKVFYITNGEMIALKGGFDFFYFVLTVVSKGDVNACASFIELCKEVVANNANYRITDHSISVLSPSFNYGSAEYNFYSQKINKGASIVEGTFEDFKAYILGLLRK